MMIFPKARRHKVTQRGLPKLPTPRMMAVEEKINSLTAFIFLWLQKNLSIDAHLKWMKWMKWMKKINLHQLAYFYAKNVIKSIASLDAIF
jgi:hypothetical protein